MEGKGICGWAYSHVAALDRLRCPQSPVNPPPMPPRPAKTARQNGPAKTAPPKRVRAEAEELHRRQLACGFRKNPGPRTESNLFSAPSAHKL